MKVKTKERTNSAFQRAESVQGEQIPLNSQQSGRNETTTDSTDSTSREVQVVVMLDEVERQRLVSSQTSREKLFVQLFVLAIFVSGLILKLVMYDGSSKIAYVSKPLSSMKPIYINNRNKPFTWLPTIMKRLERRSHLAVKCSGKVCIEAAQEIFSSLNTSVDPCENFFDFACQGWLNENPRPDYMSDWSVFEKLKMEANNIVVDILNHPNTAESEVKAVRQASQYFKTCLNGGIYEESYGQDDHTIQFLLNTLEEYGGWPMLYESGTWNSSRFDLTKSLVDMMRKFDSKVIDISFIYGPFSFVLKEANEVIIISRPTSINSKSGGSNLFSLDWEVDDEVRGLLLWRDFIVNLSKSLLKFMRKPIINETHLESRAFSLLKLQSEITDAKANLDFASLLAFKNNRGITELMELQRVLNSKTTPFKNKLNLFAILTKLFANVNINIDGSQKIFVSDASYLFGLSKIFSETEKEELANYLHFQIVLQMIPLVVSKALRNHLETLKMFSDGTTESMPIQTKCGQLTQKKFPVPLGYKYVFHKYPFDILDLLTGESERLKPARALFNNVKMEFQDLVSSSLQLSPKDKDLLKVKLQNTGLCLGYPSWFHSIKKMQNDYSGILLEGSFAKQTISLNAWLMDQKLKMLREQKDDRCQWTNFVGNVGPYIMQATIYVLLGILRLPFFSEQLPKAIIYGKLGSIMGHELAHGISGRGWTIQEDGSVAEMSNCLINQYDNFTFDELKDRNLTLNAEKTFEENLADNAGILAAYKAYKLDVGGSTDSSGEMRGLDKYTSEQLFYIGFAQTWCQSSTLESMRSSLRNDKHSHGRFRVLGALQNSYEFARAWRCPVGSKMNPRQTSGQKKCKIF